MALTPHDIGTRTFSRVSAGGVDRVEVADFLAAVARQTRDLQHQLDRAHEQVERLTAEVDAVRAESRGGAEVAEIVAITEEAVGRVRARAQADAEAHRSEADAYVREVRAEVDALRAQAEVDVETYRQETVEHASRMRTEVEAALARMRGEAEGAIRRAQAEMAAEFTERTNALVAAEQALIERLHGTAGVLHQAVDDLRERQAAASALGDATASAAAAPRSLMSVPDLDGATDEFSHLPPPPITDVR